MKESINKMEIVAPAGDFAKMKAAIKGGCDSVYLGLKGFGARRKAGNFLLSELKEAIDYAHLRGVKVYLTLNTMMKNSELELLYPKIKEIYKHGVDAFIIQDFGVLKFLKENFPEIELHASTQMTIANHVEAEYLKSLGFSRVVPARELSFEEIKSIKEKCDIELEVFVSGALCISYSGNCYLSSFVGGRSGNRGLCAQPCRKLYETNNGKSSFALSPKDQLLTEGEIEKLREIGVESIKVEGRMKSEEYVYETVKLYSQLLKYEEVKDKKTEKLFNRGYSKGYFYSENNLMNPNYSSDLGYRIAERKIGNEFELIDNIILGDGIIFLDKEFNKLNGTYINRIQLKNSKDRPKNASKGQTVIFKEVPKETKYINRTLDKKLNDEIAQKFKQESKRLEINGYIKIKTGKEVELCFEKQGVKALVVGEICEEAKKAFLEEEKIFTKLSELGDTTLKLNKLKIDYDGKAFLSFKTLKDLKRRCAEKFANNLIESYRRKTKEFSLFEVDEKDHSEPKLAVLVSNKEQEFAAQECGIEKIYYRQYDVCIEKNISKIDLESSLAGNLYQLLENKRKAVTLDWNNSVANTYALAQLSEIDNLETVYLSPELSKETIKSIKSAKLRKAMVVYGCLKAMYIEYSIFDKSGELKNENLDEFIIIKNDLGNIEIYNKEPMNLIPKYEEFKELNLDEIRMDFLTESAKEVKEIISSFRNRSKIGYTPFNYERGVY